VPIALFLTAAAGRQGGIWNRSAREKRVGHLSYVLSVGDWQGIGIGVKELSVAGGADADRGLHFRERNAGRRQAGRHAGTQGHR
jgi:hypothetical protein